MRTFALTSTRALAVLAAMVLCALPVSSEEAREDSAGRSPIVITSETMSADLLGGVAVFTGSAVARSEEMTLTADRIWVYQRDGGGFERIEAEGDVRLTRLGKVLTSDRAVYHGDTDAVTMTGSPRAVEDGNVLIGEKIIYHLGQDRIDVEGTKLYIDRETGGQ